MDIAVDAPKPHIYVGARRRPRADRVDRSSTGEGPWPRIRRPRADPVSREEADVVVLDRSALQSAPSALFVAHAACSVAADMMILAYMTSDQVGPAAGFIDLVEGAPALAWTALVPVLCAAVGQSALSVGAAVVALLPAAVLLARRRRWEGWARDRAVEDPAGGCAAPS